MRCVIRLAIGFLLLALAIGLAVPEASAKYVHPRGILMETFPRQVLVIWSAAEQVSVQLIVIIMPPFFLNLNYFETVTLKVSLKTWYTTGTGEAPQLLDDTAQWTDVVITQDGNGAITGAYLLHTITLLLPSKTATGWYWLHLRGEAKTGDVTFEGFDQVPLAVRPGGGPPYPGQKPGSPGGGGG